MTWTKRAAAAAAILTLAACADATATIEAPADPIDPAVVRAAEQVLADAPPPPEGSRIGVIVYERDDRWAITVMEPDGALHYLTYDWNCRRRYGGREFAKDVLPMLLHVGDLITWTTTDEKICQQEVAVVAKAAAVPDDEPEGMTGDR